MRKPLTVVMSLIAFVIPIAVYSASTSPEGIDPRDYFGVYLIEDGVRVSGGRSDEAGNQMLLYIDTANVSRGSTLKPSNAGFVPAVDFWLDLHRLAAAKASLAVADSRLQQARKPDWFAPTFGELERIEPGWWQRQVANMQLEPSCDVANLEIPVLWFLAEGDENVPFDSSFEALVEARKENPRLTIVTVHNAPHSFLLEDGNGRLRYTDEYWEVMVDWLNKSVLDNE